MSKNYKWLLIALLSSAFFFHQADRALFGLLTIPIQKDLALSDLQIGWINTTLSWTLAAMTVVAGFVGNKYNGKWIITLSLMAWSLMTVCMGFVGGFCGALFFRSIATGVGESFYSPSAYALIAKHHTKTRSLALSIHQSALYVGLMVSGLLVAWALDLVGNWRNVFGVFGVLGFLLGVLFIWALREGAPVASTSAEQIQAPAAPTLGEAFRVFFCNPSALCATAGFVAIVFANNAYLFWAPKFAAEKFAMSVGEAGKGVMFWHHLLALGAILLGGVVSDRFVGKWPRFRLGFQIVALLCGAPMLLLVGLAPSWTMMLVATAGYGVFRGFFEVNTHASMFDVVPPAYRSSTVGFMTLSAFVFGGLSGVVMGMLSGRFGVRGFEIGFGLMAGGYALAAVLMSISFFFTFRRNWVGREVTR